MTTGVDILFKELPAQVPSVHRERKAAPSPVRADHVDDRSNISNNKDQKAIKTFNEHLDDHNVKNDDAHKTDKTPQTDSNETDALARNPEHGNNDVITTSEIPAESNIQDQGSNAVQLNNDILFAENAQKNIAAATTEHSVVINTDINNVVDTNVSNNRADNNSGVNNTNPEQVVANTTGQPNTEKTIPAATDHIQNSEKSIPAASADEATPKTTQPQHDNKIDTTDVAADKNVEIKPDASIKETTPQNGLGDDNKLFTQTQKSSDARPVSTEVVQAPKGDENKIIPSSFVAQKTDVPMQDAKAETIVNSALLQQAPLEKTLPEETIVHEKNSATPIAVVLDRNNNQKSTDKGKSTGISAGKSAGKSKSSSANQQKSDVPVSNTGQTTQTQQSASQNIVKNDMLFDMGLKTEPTVPQPLNLNAQSSLTTGGLLAVQDINVQKSVNSLTSTIKLETAEQAKMINEQISVAISKNIIKGQNNFNIRLKPAELGQVEIRIEFLSDGKMQASMMVENEKTLSMLQRDQSVLEKALQDAGINLSNKNMNFSLMKQDQQQSQKFAGLNNPANDDGSFEDMAQTETMQEIRMGYSNQAIDISV